MNTLADFVKSLSTDTPPSGVSEELQALWYDGKGDWGKAHDIAQDIYNDNGSWIHAYLHRKEGDIQNAHYWYRKAGKSLPSVSLNVEWLQLCEYFITYKA
jgi:hypothetical protein